MRLSIVTHKSKLCVLCYPENFGDNKHFHMCYRCSKRIHDNYVRYLERRANRSSKSKPRVRYNSSFRSKVASKLAGYRSKDKVKGLFFDLDVDWYINNIYNKPCIYCGDVERVGCDRIDNSKGHIKDNCIPACTLCNITRMNNYTVEEMKIIGKSIRDIKLSRKVK